MATYSSIRATYLRCVQAVLNGVVTPAGPDRAGARWQVRALQWRPDGTASELIGVYHDEVARTDAGWRFAHRDFELVYSRPAGPARPSATPAERRHGVPAPQRPSRPQSGSSSTSAPASSHRPTSRIATLTSSPSRPTPSITASIESVPTTPDRVGEAVDVGVGQPTPQRLDHQGDGTVRRSSRTGGRPVDAVRGG